MKIDLEHKVFMEIMVWSKCMPEPIDTEVYIPSLNIIANQCEKMFGLEKNEIHKKTRKAEILIPRQFAHATAIAMKNHGAKWSLDEIGRAIGGFKYTVVHNSAKQVSNYVQTGYKKEEMREAADFFNLSLNEYIYDYTHRRQYKEIIFTSEEEELKFTSTSEISDRFNISHNTVSYRLQKGHYKQYKITYK